MKHLKIWFWVVGVFYLLLTAMNLFFIFIQPETMAGNLPAKYAHIPEAGNIFLDAWMVFIFELGAIGICSIAAAGNPQKNVLVAWLIILAEIFRGIVADSIWIGRGYDANSYSVFIVIHAIIIATGYLGIRKVNQLS